MGFLRFNRKNRQQHRHKESSLPSPPLSTQDQKITDYRPWSPVQSPIADSFMSSGTLIGDHFMENNSRLLIDDMEKGFPFSDKKPSATLISPQRPESIPVGSQTIPASPEISHELNGSKISFHGSTTIGPPPAATLKHTDINPAKPLSQSGSSIQGSASLTSSSTASPHTAYSSGYKQTHLPDSDASESDASSGAKPEPFSKSAHQYLMNRMKQRHREECRRSLLMTSDHPLAKTNRYSQSVAALHYTENTSPSRVTLIDLPPQAPYMARSTSLMTDLYQKSQLPAHAKRQSLQLTDADFHPSRLLQNQPLLAQPHPSPAAKLNSPAAFNHQWIPYQYRHSVDDLQLQSMYGYVPDSTKYVASTGRPIYRPWDKHLARASANVDRHSILSEPSATRGSAPFHITRSPMESVPENVPFPSSTAEDETESMAHMFPPTNPQKTNTERKSAHVIKHRISALQRSTFSEPNLSSIAEPEEPSLKEIQDSIRKNLANLNHAIKSPVALTPPEAASNASTGKPTSSSQISLRSGHRSTCTKHKLPLDNHSNISHRQAKQHSHGCEHRRRLRKSSCSVHSHKARAPGTDEHRPGCPHAKLKLGHSSPTGNADVAADQGIPSTAENDGKSEVSVQIFTCKHGKPIHRPEPQKVHKTDVQCDLLNHHHHHHHHFYHHYHCPRHCCRCHWNETCAYQDVCH